MSMNLSTKELQRSKFCQVATPENPLWLANGEKLDFVTLAYKTYGKLNKERNNTILIFHVLTSSQNLSGYDDYDPTGHNLWNHECQEGWWNDFVGNNCAFDTDDYFIICANYLGGCYGSTGPLSINPDTNHPYLDKFPFIAHTDVVDSQVRLLDYLNINEVYAVVGASLGGMLAHDFAVRYSQRVKKVISLSASIKTNESQIVNNLEQILTLKSHLSINNSDEYAKRGLMLAILIALKHYCPLRYLAKTIKNKSDICPDFLYPQENFKYPIESFLFYNSQQFTKRFCPHSYLRIISLFQGVEIEKEAFERCQTQEWLVFSVNSDTCFFPEDQLMLRDILNKYHISNKFVTISSEIGHDSFLKESLLYHDYIKDFLEEI
ncbi:alpha/beta fold hydrolase [Moorena sp. SIO3H5]|uniref:alpha/beta fold hydrolase n=1 Tax=Moorena sp. SIO3H5 TaxID=2607834 RepID=UPI0025F623F1|nr:alpha/beta fold hydrolase [Moorena sp. SIO3H5]